MVQQTEGLVSVERRCFSQMWTVLMGTMTFLIISFNSFFFSFVFRNSFIKSTDVPEMFLKFIFG